MSMAWLETERMDRFVGSPGKISGHPRRILLLRGQHRQPRCKSHQTCDGALPGESSEYLDFELSQTNHPKNKALQLNAYTAVYSFCSRFFLPLGNRFCAQIKVDMRIGRRLYIAYEPIMVTVAITNLSGHEIMLTDADGQKWFSFQVTADEDRIIPPLDLDYHLASPDDPAGTDREAQSESGLTLRRAGIWHLSRQGERLFQRDAKIFQFSRR